MPETTFKWSEVEPVALRRNTMVAIRALRVALHQAESAKLADAQDRIERALRALGEHVTIREECVRCGEEIETIERVMEGPVVVHWSPRNPALHGSEFCEPAESISLKAVSPDSHEGRFLAILNEYQPTHGTWEDHVEYQPDMPYCFVQSNVRGGHWIYLLVDLAEVSSIINGDEYAEDWETERLVDLRNGQEFTVEEAAMVTVTPIT